MFKKSLLGALTGGRDFVKAEVLLDVTDTIYSYSSLGREAKRHLAEFPDSLDVDVKFKSEVMPTRQEVERAKTGYCIRTGVEIPFNLSRPFSDTAFRSWSQFRNMDYAEKYCHKTGKPSYGRASMRNPILD